MRGDLRMSGSCASRGGLGILGPGISGRGSLGSSDNGNLHIRGRLGIEGRGSQGSLEILGKLVTGKTHSILESLGIMCEPLDELAMA